jgi:Sel1 repeat
LMKTKDPEMPWLPVPPSLSRLQSLLEGVDSDGGGSGHGVDREDTQRFHSNLSSSLFRKDANWWPRQPSNEQARGTGNGLLYLSAYNFSLPQLKASGSTRKDSEARSLILYALSASQGNPEAQLRVGDFHYYGKAGLRPDKFEAAVFYQLAADLRNTHAIFNLGIMHEAGDGVEQDFHLAKRFFDQAAEVDADARTPRALALFVLSSHRSIQDALGPDAAARLAELLVAYDGLADFAHRLIEFGSGVYKRLFEVATRSSERDVHKETATSTHRIRNIEVAIPREGFQEVILLLALGALFAFIQRWRSSRRRNNIARLHDE